MPTLSAGDLALLRGKNHRSQFYLTPCPATALWSARVAGSLARGETAVTFDGGSGLNFAAVGAYQELWVGSAAGLYDVGRVRIRSVSSGDAGVTGTVTLAANSFVTTDNDFLTFVGWYLLKPIRPLIGGDGTFYKDTNVTYSDQNSQPPPVCIAGENRAGFIDAGLGYFEIESQLPSSYAIASGATISSYAAALVHGSGSPTITINAGSGVGTIRFDDTGVYWIKWTVTDSNGKSQDTYRWYYAHSPIINNAHYPTTDFSINNLSIDHQGGGLSCGVQLHSDASLTDIPDHAPIILWADNWYDETKKNITYLPDESGTVINGYVRRDQFNSELSEGKHTAAFEITTIHGVNDNKYNFSVSLEAAQTVDTWWKYPSWLTPTRAAHHFFRWHSTLLQVADLIGLNSNTDGIAYAEFQDGTLLGMPNSFLKDRSIRASLICDAGGRVHVVEDVQLRADAERAGLGQVQVITNADKSGEIDFVREQENQTPFVHTSGFSFAGTFDAEGQPIANAICAIAPGSDPDEDGKSPISYGRQTFTGQTHANAIAGRVLADANNRLPEVRVNFSGNYLGTLGVHLSEFWELTIASGDTVRQITETHNLILRNVVATLSVAQGTIAATATFEAEALGQTGIATDCPTFPDLPGDDFTIPEIEDLPGALITAASVNYLPPQTKAWTVQTAEATEHLLADPFWTTRQNSFASADAILWRCGVGYIKRKMGAGAWTAVTPATDPPNDAGDTPAPTAATVTYVQGDGSYINESEFVFIARWQNASNEWRSWLVYTANDGTGWTWKSTGIGSAALDVTVINADKNVDQPQSSAAVDIDGTYVAFVVNASETSSPANLVIIDTSNNTIKSTTTIGSQTGAANPNLVAVCKLATNRLAIACADGDSLSIHTEVLNFVDGVLSTSVRKASIITYTGGAPTALSIVRLSDTLYAVACNRTGTTNKGFIVGCEYTVIGNTLASGSEYDFDTDPVGYIAMTDAATGAHIYWPDTSLARLVGRSFTISTGTLVVSYSSVLKVSDALPDNISAVNLTGDKDFIVFVNTEDLQNAYGVVVTITGNTITFADNGTELKDGTIIALYVSRISDTSAYVSYLTSARVPSYNTVTISGHVVDSVGAESAYPTGAEGYPIAYSGPTGLMLLYFDDNYTAFTYPKFHVSVEGGASGKLLGASISKGIGDILYLTMWENSEILSFQVRDMTDLSLLGSFSLGACTEAQLDAKTYYAHPLAPFGDDLFCWFYGRMQPSGIGESHIIYTADGGSSLVAFETGWGSAHCGSLVDDFGLVYAGRVSGAQTKLYAGQWDGSLAVKSTMTFPAGINPFGMVYNWFDDSIYAAAASGNSLMVLRANYPFTTWTDVTYNHGTAAGINAIVAL